MTFGGPEKVANQNAQLYNGYRTTNIKQSAGAILVL